MTPFFLTWTNRKTMTTSHTLGTVQCRFRCQPYVMKASCATNHEWGRGGWEGPKEPQDSFSGMFWIFLSRVTISISNLHCNIGPLHPPFSFDPSSAWNTNHVHQFSNYVTLLAKGKCAKKEEEESMVFYLTPHKQNTVMFLKSYFTRVVQVLAVQNSSIGPLVLSNLCNC